MLRIRFFGDPVLRKKSLTVKKVTLEHSQILSKMAQIMYEGEGVGLAAPQVGINVTMIVADVGGGLYKLINPKVVQAKGSQVNQEGCLSIPGVCIKVRRANKIIVSSLDEQGLPLNIEADGLLACVLQHEIDHLRGKLIVDYASFLEKIKIAKVLEGLKKKNKNANLSESEAKICMQL